MSSREILTRPAPPADLRLAYGAHASQFAEFRYPAGTPRALIVNIHGGFWRNQHDLAHAGNLCAALTREGFVTANLEYRRVGEEGGGCRGTFDDVAAGFDLALSHCGVRTAVMTGHSAGGHLALWFASLSPSVAAAVALAPVACLHLAWQLNLGDGAVANFLGSPHDYAERFTFACPCERAPVAPCTVVHGEDDEIVPLALSREFARAHGSSPYPVRLIELAATDHFHVIDPLSHAWPEVLRAISAATA